MLYPVILYLVAGFFGTLLALRLMAIEAQERKTILTRRGRVVVGVVCGLTVGAIVVLINGMWWNCDLTDTAQQCSVTWGY